MIDFTNKEFLENIELFHKYWNSLISEILRAHDMGVSRFTILANLGHNGKMTLTEISQIIMTKKSTVTNIIDNLEKHNLVERIRGSKDRRKIYIDLTRQGSEMNAQLHREMVPKIIKELDDIFHGFEDQDLNLFFKIMKQMKVKLKEKL